MVVLTHTSPLTGHTYSVVLNDSHVTNYRTAVQDYLKYGRSMDRARRLAHNVLAQPVVSAMRPDLPDMEESELFELGRKIVQDFLAPLTLSSMNSRVGNIRLNNLYI